MAASKLLTVDQALSLIEQHAKPLPPCELPLGDALGCLLAADAVSDIDSPPHNKAMMDGYAVVASDPHAERVVIEEVLAGATPTKQVTHGTATRIMTGAPLPPGADAVVPVELTEMVDDQTVRLPLPGQPSGKHVMLRGEVFIAGEQILRSGERISAGHLALLAETGHASVSVVPQPTVGVLATGNEFVEVQESPAAGQIRNSNGPMLRALVQEAGATHILVGGPRDHTASLRQGLAAGAACDVLLVSGGVSAGKRDLAPGVLAALGVKQVFHKLAVKPGKPLWFGVWRQASGRSTLVFGLPGNPVSGYVCFQLFVRPLLSSLAGGPFNGLPAVDVRLTQQITQKLGRETFLPATAACDADGAWQAEPTAWRGSADLRGLAAANALLRLPAAQGVFSAGSRLEVLLLCPQRMFLQSKQLT